MGSEDNSFSSIFWLWLLIVIILIVLIIVIVAYNYDSESSHNKSREGGKFDNRLALLEETFTEIYPLFESEDIEVFPTYGTLLGLVRNNYFICYDYDIDMGADVKYFHKAKEIVEKLDPEKYSITCFNLPMIKTIQIKYIGPDETRREAGHLDINFFGKRPFSDSLRETNLNFKKNYNKKDIFPLQETKFVCKGRKYKMYLPANPKALLEYWYGDNYMTHHASCSESSCKSCKC